MRYKVGFESNEVYIYDSNLISAEAALSCGQYIAMVKTEITNDIIWGRVWSRDSHQQLQLNKGNTLSVTGETVEVVFLKVKLSLIELGFDSSIMDLELPDGVSNV